MLIHETMDDMSQEKNHVGFHTWYARSKAAQPFIQKGILNDRRPFPQKPDVTRDVVA
jgi:hypothetical protein